MRKFACIILTAALACNAYAQSAAQSAISQICGSAERIEALSCDFVQKVQSAMLNGTMDSYGHMEFTRPDKLRWEYTSPVSRALIIDGDKARLINENGADVLDASSNKMVKAMSAMILGSISGESLNDTKTFATSVEENATEWIVTMTPRRQQIRQMFASIVICFDKKQHTANSITLADASGSNTTKIIFSNVKVIQK